MDPKRPFAVVVRSVAVMTFAGLAATQAQAFAAANGEVALSSQLVDRGVAITRPGPALQGAVSWSWPSGWSIGTSGGVELRDPDHVADSLIQVSRTWPVSTDWRMQTRLLYYHYSGIVHVGYYEAGLDWMFRDTLTFGLSGIYSPNRDHRFRPAADLDFRWPLPQDFSVNAGVGVASYASPAYGQYEHGVANYYRYGHLGLLWARGGWQFKFERLLLTGPDRERMRELAPSPWLATLSRSF